MYFDSNRVNTLLDCTNCDRRLSDPRLLPCGKSICLNCSLSIRARYKKFDCLICNEKHEWPKNGLPRNEALATMLTIKTIEVSRGKAYEYLQESLKEIQKKNNSFKHRLNNRVDFIKEHCLNLRNDVLLVAGTSHKKIDDFSKEMIDRINEYEKVAIDSNKTNLNSLNESCQFSKE